MDQYDGSGNNPYEFILNPEKPKKNGPFKKFGSNHFVVTIVAIVGGAIVLMITVAVLLGALTPEKVSKEDLRGLAQTQQELVRVSGLGGSDATRQTVKNLATTIQYTMLTQQKETVDLLAKNGVKVAPKELTLKQNAETDRKFTSAKATSTYDSTFTNVMRQELINYANTLKALVAKAKTQAERDRLSGYYQQTQLLSSQVPNTSAQ